MSAGSDAENQGKDEDDYKNVKRFRLKLFKFWPSKELRDVWRQYVFEDCCQDNVNAVFIAVKLLEKVTDMFVGR